MTNEPDEKNMRERIAKSLRWEELKDGIISTDLIQLDEGRYTPIRIEALNGNPGETISVKFKQLKDVGLLNEFEFVQEQVNGYYLVKTNKDGTMQFEVEIPTLEKIMKPAVENMSIPKLVELRDFLARRCSAQNTVPDAIVEKIVALRNDFVNKVILLFTTVLEIERDNLVKITRRTSGLLFVEDTGIAETSVLEGAYGIVRQGRGEHQRRLSCCCGSVALGPSASKEKLADIEYIRLE